MLLAHSGGPTSVINASLLGVVEEARRQSSVTQLFGARFGISGIIDDNLVPLSDIDLPTIGRIARSPGAALGSSRKEIEASHLEQALKVLRRRDIRCLLYNGGNGSMGTAHQIQTLARESGYELQVVGIPKTIDNDIVGTDHTPGYGSAARFAACAVRDIGADLASLGGQVVVVEILGRNVGWIVGATALARKDATDAPHLIYFPEERLPLAKLLEDVDAVFSRQNQCLVAVCEGQLDENGEPFGAEVRFGSRGSLAMNLGHRLAILISQHLKLRARSEKPGLLGRSSAASVSVKDWAEARLCGHAAVRAALEGSGGNMVSLIRSQGPRYCIRTGLVPLSDVAFIERPLPPEWKDLSRNDVGPAFCDWLQTLTGSIDHFEKLPIAP